MTPVIDTLSSTTMLFLIIVGLTGIERLIELRIGAKNQRWSMDRGGQEYGHGHWPWMVLLHTGFLLSMVAEALLMPTQPRAVLTVLMLAVALASQGLRWWCIRTLGHRWNPRVIVVPGTAPVRSGPYRWIKHPNYVAVAMEGIALPMIHACWRTALGFTIANAFLMVVRIRCENTALELLQTDDP